MANGLERTQDEPSKALVAQVMGLRWCDWRLILLAFLGSRLVIITPVLMAMAAGSGEIRSGFFSAFCAWDCQYYLQIASQGYDAIDGIWSDPDAPNWAFFPLLPLLVSGFAALTGLPIVASSLIVPNALFLLTLVLFVLYVKDHVGENISRYSLLVMAFWPFSVHASVGMSESAFLPLSLAVVHAARNRSWIEAGLFAALLSSTRAVGVLIVVPMLMIALQERRILDLLLVRPGAERIMFALGASGAGLAAFMIYLHWTLGDALAFSHVQVGWYRQFKWPWMTVYDDLNPLVHRGWWILYNASNIFAGVVGLAASIILWRRSLKPEAVLLGIIVVIALCSGASTSIPRFVGNAFPCVIAFVMLTAESRTAAWMPSALALGLAGIASTWVTENMYVM